MQTGTTPTRLSEKLFITCTHPSSSSHGRVMKGGNAREEREERIGKERRAGWGVYTPQESREPLLLAG